MRHRIGPGEHAACLAVEAFAVGEEQRPFGRELLAYLAALTDIAGTYDRAAGYLCSLSDDEVVGLHRSTYSRGCVLTAEDSAVDQRGRGVND